MTDLLSVARLVLAVQRMQTSIDTMRDTLNAADRALGDGDTGMTVANVVSAWASTAQTPFEDVGTMLQQLARETRRASGSSLASVLAIGLAAAGKAAGASIVDRQTLVGMLSAAADAIVERSGASPGDKTILDSLLAMRNAVAKDRDVVEAVRDAVEEFRPREARIGRARIYGAKSAGLDDPGMLAALLLLQAA